ncbi:MAG TPA: hypothetical protein PKD78_16295, partial [Saprospiraceae bacterium]|nr:hypothetical protein [Saprospiraceae bacterium]
EPAPGGGHLVSGIPKGTDITIRIADGSPLACHRDTLIAGLPCNCQAPPKPVPLAVSPVCEGGTATFQVEIPHSAPNFPHLRVDWFAQASGGTPVLTNSNFWFTTTLQSYWAETYDTLTHCRSTERTRLDVTVNPNPHIEVLETPCESDYLHYSLVVKRLPSVNFSIQPAVGNPPVLGADRITFSGIPEGTALTITATHAQTGCFSTLPLISPECGCPLIDPPTGVPSTRTYCKGASIPGIVVGVKPGETADWLSADGDTLLLNSTIFQPADSTATYYVRTRNIANSCTSEPREVKIVVHALPVVGLTAPACDSDLQGYSVQFNTTGTPASPQPAGMLFSDGMGGYLISEVPKGQAISFVVTDAATTCSRTVQVAAPEC